MYINPPVWGGIFRRIVYHRERASIHFWISFPRQQAGVAGSCLPADIDMPAEEQRLIFERVDANQLPIAPPRFLHKLVNRIPREWFLYGGICGMLTFQNSSYTLLRRYSSGVLREEVPRRPLCTRTRSSRHAASLFPTLQLYGHRHPRSPSWRWGRCSRQLSVYG